MAKQVKDDFIMDTNNSSIVSKRSVEKLYYAGQPEYFRYFVNKFKRRSPLINRGYHLRMKAVEYAVEQFLTEPTDKKKDDTDNQSDPLPWLFLGKRLPLCHNAKFIDVDYSPLMHKKVAVIKRTSQLTDTLPDITYTAAHDGILCDSERYAAVGCDLRNLDILRLLLRERLHVESCSIAVLFVAEVSTAYMDLEGSQAVLEWASAYQDVRFCLLEQHLPDGKDHPFARTMLKHFEKLRTPLHAIGTISDMKKRFERAGWAKAAIDVRSLWHLWSDPTFLTVEEKRALDQVEPFDEWEELALFGSHYFLLIARKGTIADTAPDRSSEVINLTSLHPNGKNNDNQTIAEPGPPLLSVVCEAVSNSAAQRRFAALLPSDAGHGQLENEQSFALHAGLGTRERLTDATTYVLSDATPSISGPPLIEGIMCHTITSLTISDCLLVGGRTSPNKASEECWLRSGHSWSRVHNLPRGGRYRHGAAPVVLASGEVAVLIHGGRASTGEILSDFLLWRRDTGWSDIPCSSAIARFGATMYRRPQLQVEGCIIGGMQEDYSIDQQQWHWLFDEVSETIKLRKHYSMTQPHVAMCRFGAHAVEWRNADSASSEMFILGGINIDGMLHRDHELFNLSRQQPHLLKGDRPLLIGACSRDRTSIGGGATCFSFGTYWSEIYRFQFQHDTQEAPSWHVLAAKDEQQCLLAESIPQITPNNTQDLQTVRIADLQTESFQTLLTAAKPVILRGCDMGSCISAWSPEYLKTAIGERKVVIHSSDHSKLDFQTKNFKYEEQQFDKFMDAVCKGDRLYLRALSASAPSEQPADLAIDFPEVAGDFILPPELQVVKDNAHSSVLRIAGPVTMWLHYDVMSNVLCQVRGTKTLLLYPPEDIVHLGVGPGMSSSSIDVFSIDTSAHPGLQSCHPHEAKLLPGDILFIPRLWLHSATPGEGLSIAVNVFFRDLEAGYAAGRDVYGNRDLAAYERGRKDIAKLAKSFAGLPADVNRFYIERLIMELRSLARTK